MVKLKGKAYKRAVECSDSIRLMGDIPLIVDKTEIITPEIAHDMLQRNKHNRPINWKKVEEYAALMAKGDWILHSLGIILDENDNILTGQKRLWAIIYSDTAVAMRVSRGCPANTVRMIDRGEPQSSRDMAARETARKHSPYEVSLARGVLVLKDKPKPSKDQIADVMIQQSEMFSAVLIETKGTKKTKSILMILSAICFISKNIEEAKSKAIMVETYAGRLDVLLSPSSAVQCWGKGAAFTLSMKQAQLVVSR
jgi:hypothetical protein